MAIQADAEAGPRKRVPEFRQQAMQQTHDASRAGGVARPEQRRDEVLAGFVIKRQARDQRQITPVVVEAIEEGQLLRAVRLVFGRVEVDRDPPHAAAATPMPGNHGVGQRVAQAEQPSGRGPVLEARDRRLRRQPAAVERIAIHQQLVDRIVGESVGVIPVGMATRDREDALREQVADPVRHAGRRARLGRRRRQRGQQAEPAVGRLEQERAPIRAGVRLVERGDERAIDEGGKQNSLWYGMVVQQRRLRVAKGPSASPLYHSEAFLFLPTHRDS